MFLEADRLAVSSLEGWLMPGITFQYMRRLCNTLVVVWEWFWSQTFYCQKFTDILLMWV